MSVKARGIDFIISETLVAGVGLLRLPATRFTLAAIKQASSTL
jgi:hypothetical protein